MVFNSEQWAMLVVGLIWFMWGLTFIARRWSWKNKDLKIAEILAYILCTMIMVVVAITFQYLGII